MWLNGLVPHFSARSPPLRAFLVLVPLVSQPPSCQRVSHLRALIFPPPGGGGPGGVLVTSDDPYFCPPGLCKGPTSFGAAGAEWVVAMSCTLARNRVVYSLVGVRLGCRGERAGRPIAVTFFFAAAVSHAATATAFRFRKHWPARFMGSERVVAWSEYPGLGCLRSWLAGEPPDPGG